MTESIQLGHLRIEISEDDESVTLRFFGEVDEDFQKDKILIHTEKPVVRLDLENISGFNSCGIREWVFWVQDLSLGRQLIFVHCSIPMIDQINMIPQSLGTGKIESFFAPYFCQTCGEVNRLIQLSEHSEKIHQKKAPHFNCDTCEGHLTFDSMDSSYFLFIDHQKNISEAC